MIFLIQVYVLSDSKRLTPYSCIRDITKEKHNKVCYLNRNQVLLGLHTEVDNRGFNEAVTLAIYNQSKT